jgi:hypothetical protein
LEGYEIREDGILLYICRVYVPNYQELKNLLLSNMYKVPYARHLGYQEMIFVVKKKYFWPGMKKEVVDFIVICLECHKVKVEYIHSTGLLQPFPIPEWKWEVVTMDFVTKLPNTAKQHDYIMVVMDKTAKASHFVSVKSTHKETDIVEIYMCEITKLHGVPKTIVSDRDSNFTSNFWK